MRITSDEVRVRMIACRSGSVVFAQDNILVKTSHPEDRFFTVSPRRRVWISSNHSGGMV